MHDVNPLLKIKLLQPCQAPSKFNFLLPHALILFITAIEASTEGYNLESRKFKQPPSYFETTSQLLAQKLAYLSNLNYRYLCK
jgi:hypothetical protein